MLRYRRATAVIQGTTWNDTRCFSFIDTWLLRTIARYAGDAPVQVYLGDGETRDPRSPWPVIRILDRATALRVLLDPDVGFGDGYMAGRIRADGDLVAALEGVYRAIGDGPSPGWLSSVVSRWLQRAQNNTLRGSHDNIERHYDLGTDFYELWLDRELVYTCAYFPDPAMALEEAQVSKMDYVCRKLALRPGETVVEAGCGWGALALHMARHYNVSVKAFNISREQIRYARRRAAAEGLSHRVEFVEDDYRNMRGHYDVFVSVGMLEHVGVDHYAEFGDVIQRAIGNSGRGLLHFIGRNRPYHLSNWIRRRVFPGAHPPSLREASPVLERGDYMVLDVENLRLHYARTLEHWLERFEQACANGSGKFSDEFLRAWRLYLAGSLVAFRVGTLQLFQIVFAGRDCANLPWTRDGLYNADAGAQMTWKHSTSSS